MCSYVFNLLEIKPQTQTTSATALRVTVWHNPVVTTETLDTYNPSKEKNCSTVNSNVLKPETRPEPRIYRSEVY